MGTTLLRYGLFGAILLSLAISSACFVCADEEQMEILRAMKIGVDEQLRGVEFKCTYTYSEHVVDTREEAERFDTSKGRLVVHATGVLAKTKKMTYESFNIGTLETKHPMFYMSHVTVTNPELRANYVKQSPQHPHRRLFVSERREENKDLPILDGAYAPIISPLLLGGGRAIPNFAERALRIIDGGYDNGKITVTHDQDSTKVSTHYAIPGVEISDTSYFVSNAYPYPVLTDVVDKAVHPQREISQYLREINQHLKAFDFIQLNEGYVLPQKIHMFSPIVFDFFRPEDVGKWCVTKWESEDMGKEKPKKSDFYIYLDRNSAIRGLALDIEGRLNRNLPEYFDINEYGVRDLQSSSPLESQIDKAWQEYNAWQESQNNEAQPKSSD